jgi:mRNA-degrading endonuclease RelE of RelBE toxin-antitoxin system
MKAIIYTSEAAKDFDALPAMIREQVERALSGFAVTGRGDVKSLKGRDGYRLRVRGARVLFKTDSEATRVFAVARRAPTAYR